MSAEMTGIERYFLQQKVAELHDLRAKLAGKIGFAEANDITCWYAAVKDIGCPNCGFDFREGGPEMNMYPHFIGSCAERIENLKGGTP